MRALHLVKTSSGATWAFRQMRELVTLGVEVHVGLPDGGPLAPHYRSAGIIVHPLEIDLASARPWSWPNVFDSMRELVSRVAPDIIHSHFVGTTATARLALGKHHPVPRIFQVPGPLHLEHSVFRTCEIALAGPLDYWVASCQWTYQRYIALGIQPGRLHLSYYGTDLDSLQQVRGGHLRGELGVDHSVRIVGMVAFIYRPKWYLGQVRGIKGHEDLIDAISICRKAYPQVLCVMVGGDWNGAASYGQRVRAYARKVCGDRIIFLGTRSDVPRLYRDFDVAVHPSHSENLGGAAESLLLGVPTIATDVGGLPDLVIHGDTGWLVPPRTPRRLAEAIQEALAHPEEAGARARRGQARALGMLDVQQTSRQICDFYQKILARRGSKDRV